MTRPSLAGIEQRTAAATAETFEVTYGTRERARVWIEDDTTPFAEFIVGDAADAQLFAHARTDLDALTAAVRDVLTALAPHWDAQVRREAKFGRSGSACVCEACDAMRALAAHLDLTDPEGEPT